MGLVDGWCAPLATPSELLLLTACCLHVLCALLLLAGHCLHVLCALLLLPGCSSHVLPALLLLAGRCLHVLCALLLLPGCSSHVLPCIAAACRAAVYMYSVHCCCLQALHFPPCHCQYIGSGRSPLPWDSLLRRRYWRGAFSDYFVLWLISASSGVISLWQKPAYLQPRRLRLRFPRQSWSR